MIRRFVIVSVVMGLWGWRLGADVIKIGTVIPDGPKVSVHLKAMAKEIEEKTQKRVELRFIWGGVAGDEEDVIRKIRGRQFQGGIFTAKTLSDEVGDIRLLEVPFMFKSRDESKAALAKISDNLTAQFKSKGFQNLGIYEFGEIFLVTKDKVASVKELSGKKLWWYQGDKLAAAFSNSLNLTPVPAALPEVSTSLDTGLLSAAYAPAIGILALQWHTKVKFLIEPPFAYHFQALIVDAAVIAKLSAGDQKIVKEVANSYVAKISEGNIADAAEAKATILKSGVTTVTWPESDVVLLKEVKEKVLKELTGTVLTKERVEEVTNMQAPTNVQAPAKKP